MDSKKFYVQLAVLALLVALAMIPMHQHELIQKYQLFSWVSWGFFVLFSMAVFMLCSKTAKSENKNTFGQVFLLSILFKLMFCGLWVIAYALIVKPQSAYFVLPFLFIYLTFSVYEVYFVTKLAKT
jgi:hypothetical protein